jgi:hypothetical protein
MATIGSHISNTGYLDTLIKFNPTFRKMPLVASQSTKPDYVKTLADNDYKIKRGITHVVATAPDNFYNDLQAQAGVNAMTRDLICGTYKAETEDVQVELYFTHHPEDKEWTFTLEFVCQ